MSDKNDTALRIAIEQLVMHKRHLFVMARSDDYKPSGFVGLGSGFWLRIETLAALLDLPASEETTDDWAHDNAARLLEQGEHPWVCSDCHPELERIGPAAMQGAAVVASVYGDEPPRCYRCEGPAVARLRRHPHRWGSDVEPWRL